MDKTGAHSLLLISVLALITGLPVGASAQSPAIPAALQQVRIQPLSPPIAAPDFRLPTLAGGELSLSDNKGRWVLLTFFATWCGPCKTEMPSLQRFHEQYGPRGFDVFGVSTDSSVGIVKPFARSFGLTFPIGVDTGGQAAQLYQASSIPVSFLISPEGQVVGVARGARNWSDLDDMVETLLGALPTNPDAPDAFASNATPLELPEILEPPEGEYTLSTTTLSAGDDVTLDVRITWAGHFQDYLLHPPKVPVPDGLTQRSMTAHTSSTEGKKVVRYQFTFNAPSEGKFALDPIELRYTPRFENQPIASRIAGPTLTVAPPAFTGTMAGILGAALLGLLALGVGVYRFRTRTTASESSKAPALSPEILEAQLQTARQQRHRGNIAEYLTTLSEMNQAFPENEQPLSSLDELIAGVRYGGNQPSPRELDSLHRQIELKLASLRPDAHQEDRELLARTQNKGVTP